MKTKKFIGKLSAVKDKTAKYIIDTLVSGLNASDVFIIENCTKNCISWMYKNDVSCYLLELCGVSFTLFMDIESCGYTTKYGYSDKITIEIKDILFNDIEVYNAFNNDFIDTFPATSEYIEYIESNYNKDSVYLRYHYNHDMNNFSNKDIQKFYI